MREPGRTAGPSATLLGTTKKARRVLWYPTQAKTGLEWGTPGRWCRWSKLDRARLSLPRGKPSPQDDDWEVGTFVRSLDRIGRRKQQVPPLHSLRSG